MASAVDLGAATDAAIGYAAVGVAYIGEMELSVKFADPFPEDLHLKAACDGTVSGVAPIAEKRIQFRLQSNPSNRHAQR